MEYKHIVLTGYSGSGKTFIGAFIADLFRSIIRCVSFTTRKPRDTEQNAKDYFFVTKERFSEKERNGEFIETNSYLEKMGLKDYWYGTPRAFVEEYKKKGTLLFNVDPNGAEKLKKYFGDECITVFIDADINVLKQRILDRRTNESDEEIAARIALIDIQAAQKHSFDYCLANEQGEEKAKKLAAHILSLARISVTA